MSLNYTVRGYTFDHPLSDNSTYAHQAGLKGLALIKFRLKVALGYWMANKRLKKSIKDGVCYYGPFKGEFGHFTAHTLPFLMYLNKNGVKIIYCGMELHEPLLVDESGTSIIHDFRFLRDFFAEVSPSSNSVVPPDDVQQEITVFDKEATSSGKAFWNIGDNFYYWFIHRNWLMNGHTHTYDLSKVYQSKPENACAIFPRSKGAKSSKNNGEQWNYPALINRLKPHFDKIYILGHPSQVLAIEPQDKVELRITADNAKILEACSNSRLIITQHSGVNNLGEYVNTQVLIIYKGGEAVTDIGSMNNTLRFRESLNEVYPLDFAFSEDEVEEYVRNLEPWKY